MREIKEVDDKKKGSVKDSIKAMQGNFGGDNNSQMSGVQILKFLATSDDPKANEFMKALNTATTDISKKVLGEKSVKKESKLKEGYIRDLLYDKYPRVWKKVGEISEMLEWSIDGAMSFALELLHDVNAHSEANEIEKIFDKQMKSFGESIIVKGNGELLDMDEEYSVELETGKKYTIQEIK